MAPLPMRAGLVALGLLVLGTLGYCAAEAGAEEHETTVMYVFDLRAPAVEVPAAFGEHAAEVARCETGGSFDWHRVGALGERGQFQLHPIHAVRARRMGLDYWGDTVEAEHDRVLLAVAIWREQSWQPWSCRPLYGGADR